MPHFTAFSMRGKTHSSLAAQFIVWALLIPLILGVWIVPACAELNSDQWRTFGQNSGRWNSNPASAMQPPISLYGVAQGGSYGNGHPEVLLDGTRFFTVDNYAIRCFQSFNQAPVVEGLRVPNQLWMFGRDATEFPGPELSIRYAPLIAGSRLILAQDYFTSTVQEIVALDKYDGEEQWKVVITEARDVSIVSDGAKVYVYWFNIPEAQLYTQAYNLSDGSPVYATPTPIDGEGAGYIAFIAMNNGRIARTEGYAGIVVHDAATGEEIWRDIRDGDGSTGTNIRDNNIMMIDDKVIFTKSDKIYVLNEADGSEIWTKSIDTCSVSNTNPTMIASDGTYIAHASLCDTDLVVWNMADGSEAWRVSRERATNPILLLSGPYLYYSYLPEGVFEFNIDIYDITDGTLLGSIEPDGFIETMVTADGLLYVVGPGSEGFITQKIRAFERQPTDLELKVLEEPVCNSVLGATVTYRFEVANHGPGSAEGVQLSILRNDGDAVISGTLGNCSGTGIMFCDLPDIASGGSHEFTIDISPLMTGRFRLSINLDHSLRDPNTDNNRYAQDLDILDAPPGGIDINVIALEVTQGIQKLANEVYLVENKPTLVRAYVDSNGTVTPGVSASLFGTRGGMPLPGSPLQIVQGGCIQLPSTPPNRLRLGETLNFLLPPEWRIGDVDLTLVVDPDNKLPDPNPANNQFVTAIQFLPVAPICMKPFAVHTKDSEGNSIIPNAFILISDLNDRIIDRMMTLLPANKLRIYPQPGKVIEEWQGVKWGPYEFGNDKNRVQASLWTRDQLTAEPEYCRNNNARTHYLGYVDQRSDTNFNGLGLLPGDSLTVTMRESLDNTTETYNQPYGGRTLAHELGHNYGRKHIDCGGPVGTDDDFPHPRCQFAPALADGLWGVDLMDLDNIGIIDPTMILSSTVGDGDLMSYHRHRWTSDYTWHAVMQELYCQQYELCVWPPGGPRPHQPPKSPPLVERLKSDPEVARIQKMEETLLINGYVGQLNQIEYAARMATGIVPESKLLKLWSDQLDALKLVSAHTLDLVGSTGTVLASYTLDVNPLGDDEGNAFFGTAIPYDAATAIIRITGNGMPLVEYPVSANAPSISIVGPMGGENFDLTMPVAWTASDDDGDTITVTVRYSHDSGANWEVLKQEIQTDSYTFDTSQLAGGSGTCMVELIASDGVNTALDRSGLFSVALRNPIAAIRRRPLGWTFYQDELIVARGQATDPEDGPLDDMSLRWTIGSYLMGTGEEVHIRGLNPGTYTLVLTATDSDGNMATDETLIRINPRLRPTESNRAVDWGRYF